jgi:tripartite-type tricarboxylate transporter receptor subunit TctC
MITKRTVLAAMPGLLAAPHLARAQAAWPNGPIRIVVPFPPGGGADGLARMLQPRLQVELGVPVIIDNRPGASGALGAAQVARAAADGNTWLIMFDTHAVNPALIENMGFDTEKDLTALFLFGTAPMILTTHPSRPFRSLQDVMAAAKTRPDSITYGTIGNGSLAHLTMALAGRLADFRLIHVAYRGGGPLATAAASGEVDLAISSPAALGAQMEAGTILGLAQTSRERSPRFPDLPTMKEAGIQEIDARAFWGFAGPARLPSSIRQRMEAALLSAVSHAETAQRITGLGIDLHPQGEAAFSQFLSTQIATWGRVVRENNIRPD